MRVNRALLLLMPALAIAAGMRTRRRSDLAGRVVVITGASSGIGRAAALVFAARGCRVAVAARRAALLDEVVAECRAAGADALAVPTDVTREDDVVALRDRALARWGRIDVWINNAGVTVYARIDEGATRDHERVLDTNLLGPFYAARAVVPVFRQQGTGTLINVTSVLSKVGHARVPSYVVSKFALRGLSETLRVELADEPGIHICTILPYAVDTPHFESAGDAIGRQAHVMPPVQSPEKVALAIVDLAERPRRELHVPRGAAVGLTAHALWPRTAERLILRALLRFHFGAPQPTTQGGLFEPCPGPGSIHGHRPPLVSGARFTLWAIRELAAIVAANAGVLSRPGARSPESGKARGDDQGTIGVVRSTDS